MQKGVILISSFSILSTGKSRAFQESRAEEILLFRILSTIFIPKQPETGWGGGGGKPKQE